MPSTALPSGEDSELVLPEFLENVEEETNNHKSQAAKNLKHLSKQFDIFLTFIEDQLFLKGDFHGHSVDFSHYDTSLRKLEREKELDENQLTKLDNVVETLKSDLKCLKGENDKIQDEILKITEDIEMLTLQQEELCSKRKENCEELRSTWDAYVAAKKKYKSNIWCHIRVDQFDPDTNAKEGNVSFTFSYLVHDKVVLEVKLNRNDGVWEMLQVQPPNSGADEACRNLLKTNNIRAFLCDLRTKALASSRT